MRTVLLQCTVTQARSEWHSVFAHNRQEDFVACIDHHHGRWVARATDGRETLGLYSSDPCGSGACFHQKSGISMPCSSRMDCASLAILTSREVTSLGELCSRRESGVASTIGEGGAVHQGGRRARARKQRGGE